MDINEVYEKYKSHPRVIEVRFIILYEMILRDFGVNQTMKFFSSICSAFNCNYTFLNGIINRRFDIKKNSKRNRTLWRQEIIFSSLCYGESLFKVANDYLCMTPANLYQQKELYLVENFCTDDWLLRLDTQVTLCGEPSYKLEVLRFFEAMDMMSNIIQRWKVNE